MVEMVVFLAFFLISNLALGLLVTFSRGGLKAFRGPEVEVWLRPLLSALGYCATMYIVFLLTLPFFGPSLFPTPLPAGSLPFAICTGMMFGYMVGWWSCKLKSDRELSALYRELNRPPE